MPTFQFEAMDNSGPGDPGRDRSPQPGRAQATIRADGVFRHQDFRQEGGKRPPPEKVRAKDRAFAIGGVKQKVLTAFTRQLSILQDAGLPILRSLRILEAQSKPGRMKNSLIDVCDEIEGGSTLSEAMAKAPRPSTGCTST